MPRAPAALPRGSAPRSRVGQLLQRRHLGLQAFVLALGLVGSEHVCTGRALAPAPPRGGDASRYRMTKKLLENHYIPGTKCGARNHGRLEQIKIISDHDLNKAVLLPY